MTYTKKEYRNVSQQLEICMHCPRNKQYEEGIQKWEKAYLMDVGQ